MKSAKLARALARGNVCVRTGRGVTGQISLTFRNPEVKNKVLTAYPLQDQHSPQSFTNLSRSYSAEQLKNSNLEDLIVQGDLELQTT